MNCYQKIALFSSLKNNEKVCPVRTFRKIVLYETNVIATDLLKIHLWASRNYQKDCAYCSFAAKSKIWYQSLLCSINRFQRLCASKFQGIQRNSNKWRICKIIMTLGCRNQGYMDEKRGITSNKFGTESRFGTRSTKSVYQAFLRSQTY